MNFPRYIKLQMKSINKAFENKGLSVRAKYCLVQLSAVDP